LATGEQITFTQLLDIFRQEQALDALHMGERSMVNLAYQLGYNEQSSFNRASVAGQENPRRSG